MWAVVLFTLISWNSLFFGVLRLIVNNVTQPEILDTFITDTKLTLIKDKLLIQNKIKILVMNKNFFDIPIESTFLSVSFNNTNIGFLLIQDPIKKG